MTSKLVPLTIRQLFNDGFTKHLQKHNICFKRIAYSIMDLLTNICKGFLSVLWRDKKKIHKYIIIISIIIAELFINYHVPGTVLSVLHGIIQFNYHNNPCVIDTTIIPT